MLIGDKNFLWNSADFKKRFKETNVNKNAPIKQAYENQK